MGRYNTGEVTRYHESNMPHQYDIILELNEASSVIYNPFKERTMMFTTNLLTALRDIFAGDEILDNYIPYYSDGGASELREWCSGEQTGYVYQYDNVKENSSGREDEEQE
jgi:hypothetical protein